MFDFIWDFIKGNFWTLIILLSVWSVSGVVSAIQISQNEIKNILGQMLKDPKNIIVEDMKILAGAIGFGENEKKIIDKNKKWKIIGIISLFFNGFFIFLIILSIIYEKMGLV